MTLQVVSHTRWLLNSEGSVIQTGRNYVRVFLQAETRADDGMELERFESYDAASFDSLAGVAEMQKGADSMIADLKALRKAPLADPYIGPAILEGRAAGVFFHEIFGHRVEGHRQKNEDEGQTFAKKIGEPVMPAFVSVYDDPTLSRIGDVELNGFYRYDDEAVTAQRATLVDQGVLTGFLLSRSPTRGFHESNGHGRRQEGRPVVSRQGNLVVQTSAVVPVDELRRRLREEAKRQGKRVRPALPRHLRRLHQHHAHRAAVVQGAADPGLPRVGRRAARRAGARRRPGRHAAVVAVAHPGVGRRLPDVQRLLRRRVGLRAGVGDQPQPAGAADRDRAARQGQRQTAGAPGAFAARAHAAGGAAMSARIVRLRWFAVACCLSLSPFARADSASASAPPAGARRPADDAAVERAMRDELGRSTLELRLGDEPKPYYVAYTISDIDQATVSATFGAVTSDTDFQARVLRTDVRVGDPSFDNSNFEGSGGHIESLPIEDDYAALRRELWLRTDEGYKSAVETLARKRSTESGQAKGDGRRRRRRFLEGAAGARDAATRVARRRRAVGVAARARGAAVGGAARLPGDPGLARERQLRRRAGAACSAARAPGSTTAAAWCASTSPPTRRPRTV